MNAGMDLPATCYGKLDKRNPVILTFERDIKSLLKVMKRVASSTNRDDVSNVKGVQILMEILMKYKHRLPVNLYQGRMLDIADFLFRMKMYQLALWHGYSPHLLQYTSVKITDIIGVADFMACFFPQGFDKDQDIFSLKIRAMQGCVTCIYEQEKRNSILSQTGLCKLLRVLNFIRIMMQAFQQDEQLCWLVYNGSLHIYNICRYLMTKNCGAQAIEYLLWASISLELSVPLMTSKNLPWIVTLYCAVCQCYYDNQMGVQAETFARRALAKIDELAKIEEHIEIPATRETQRAFREASIKLTAMVFKRAVFKGNRRPKSRFIAKTKRTLKDISKAPWPRNTTEKVLIHLFDSSATQFLGILEALWDCNQRPLQTRMPEEPELHDVIIELLSAGISILSGSLSALTPTSTLVDLAITGENKVPIMSAIRFIKLLFRYKQPEEFADLAKEMLQVLPGVEGQLFRRAEVELTLLDKFNSLVSSQRRCPGDEDNTDDAQMSFQMSDEFTDLVDTLHKSVCDSSHELQPDGDLVLDAVIYLWEKVKLVLHRDQMEYPKLKDYLQSVDNYDKWLWCLFMLCEVGFACDLATFNCLIMADMIHTLAILLENAAEQSNQKQHSGEVPVQSDSNDQKLNAFSFLESSSTELLKRVCTLVQRGLAAICRGVVSLLPKDCSAIINCAVIQKFKPHPPSSRSQSSPTSSAEMNEEFESNKEKEELETGSFAEGCRHARSTHSYLLAADFHHELNIIYQRVSVKLLQKNAVTEAELLDRIKKNKVARAVFLIQRALALEMEPSNNSKTKSLLEEAFNLIEKAGLEEKKLYLSTVPKNLTKRKDKEMKEEEEYPPPPPVILSRTDCSFTFAPALYNLQKQVSWYQLCGRAADTIYHKVCLGDCSLPGTGDMVPVSDECVLRVEGLVPNQKYVFAVAAYNGQGRLLSNAIGATTIPLLASMPVPLLSTWVHLAQVAFQTEQYVIAKRACRELWSHFSGPGSFNKQDRLATAGLCVQTLQRSSPHLVRLFLTSIFNETEINIQQGSLYCDSISHNGPFIWEQEARLVEYDRMLVAADLGMWLNDGNVAVQAIVGCYGLLAPLIFHQLICDPVVQVLRKCLIVLEENVDVLKRKWKRHTSKSLLHMIACITYYLSKAFRVLREHQMASVVIDCGRKLLQEVCDSQMQITTLANEAMRFKGCEKTKKDRSKKHFEMKERRQLKALHLIMKTKGPEAVLIADNEHFQPQSGCDDPTMFYDVITNAELKDAYQEVMKLRRKSYFTELAALLLQRVMEEGNPDLVLQWGQNMLDFLSSRYEGMGLSRKGFKENGQDHRSGSSQTAKEHESLQQNKNTICHVDMRKKLQPKTYRETQIVENLLTRMSSVVMRNKKRLQLRNMCCEERVWRAHLNHSMAKAHLALLYQGLYKLHGEDLQFRYSQINPLCFSLAYCGVLVRRSSQPLQSTETDVETMRCTSHSGLRDYVASHQDKGKEKEESEEGNDSSQTVDLQININRQALLESLNKAALHLRRAMVLAHRGSHWTTLLCVCRTVWDHSCHLTDTIQRVAQPEPASPITTHQLHITFTPLLVCATDLILDMLNRLGLLSFYDSDLTEEELESSLYYSALLDDSTHVDLRWIRTLVFHTLEHLHDCGKWETLAHFALVFNSYTRERYALMITPLLVHAQRRLLERIRYFGGPAVPQPHHVRTKMATGKEVTYQSYASSQLLTGWALHSAKQSPHPTKAALTYSSPQNAAELRGAQMQHSKSLVCVPLDVGNTLSCYREALERRPRYLQVFQHSRSLLLTLLSHIKLGFSTSLRHSHSRNESHCVSQVEFSPLILQNPNSQPYDLTEEDFSHPNSLYKCPVSAHNMSAVIAAYSTSIKHLQASGHASLRVLALHESGNLQFFNGNPRAAHSDWSKAVDCALQSSGTVEKWDGLSFGCGSMQQTLKKAGIWGCLQAAVLTAKIARYILTSDIGQRTKCSLLSAYLFKCVLCCSLAQPQNDLQYADHNIGDGFLPGVNLFSEPCRLQLDATVSSLNFICYWLYTTGYHITLLPMIAIYLHFVGTVCRDVQRFAEAKILKIRCLTELCLFTEAVKEAVQLPQGAGVPLPCGYYIPKDNFLPAKTFFSNKSLLDNAEALEELVNSNFTPEIYKLYGSTLCVRYDLARIQLVLALSNIVHGPPVSDFAKEDPCANSTSCSVNSKQYEQETQETDGSFLKTKEAKGLNLHSQKEKLTPGWIKFFLLERASSLLDSAERRLAAQACSETEKLELEIQSNLLKSNLFLQQGNTALSYKMAVSSLSLLETSPVVTSRSKPSSQNPTCELPFTATESKKGSNHCNVSNLLHEDCPRAVEAGERIGVSIWLHCRLALIHSLAAHNPGCCRPFPDTNINEETAQVLQDGLDECARWGDLDVQALLMVEAAQLCKRRGRTDESMALLQETVSRLSGQNCMTPKSHVTLARATLLLSELRGLQSRTLLKLTQKLLHQQLCAFGQSLIFDGGKLCFSPPGPRNMYLPYISLLDQANLQTGNILNLGAVRVSAHFSQ